MVGSKPRFPAKLLAGAALFTVFFLDRVAHFFLGDITLAPLLAVISLAALAFFLRPKAVLLCTPAFALLCFLLLTFWRHSLVLPGFGDLPEMETPVSYGRGFVRSLTVLIAGGLCALLSLQREQLQNAVDETVAVMTALPSGVLISDSSGLISFANDRAAQILNVAVENLLGSSYFSLLTLPEGNTIEKYAALSELPGENSGRLMMSLRKEPNKRLVAQMFCLKAASGRLVATVFDEPARTS